MLTKLKESIKLKELIKFKEYSLIIIPTVGGTHKKSIILKSWRILIYLLAFVFVFGLLSFFLFSYTPLKYFIITSDENMVKQNNEISVLNQKVIFLTRELENITSLNKRLKYAIMLGDSSLFDTLKNKQKKSNMGESVSPFGGNIFFILNKIFADTTSIKIRPAYFINPVSYGFVTKGFNSGRGHMGIDFAVKTGTNVYAAASGYVVYADYSADDGYMIILMHDENYITVYKHCSVLTKKIRDRVIQGEVIALSGNTGLNTTGPHLHFEVWKDGQVINPKLVLK